MVGVGPHFERGYLLPQTKLTEDGIEQIFRRGFADDFANGLDALAQIQGDKLQRGISPQRVQRQTNARSRPIQSVLMAGIDCHLRHFSGDIARPHERFDRVLKRLNAVAGFAANPHYSCKLALTLALSPGERGQQLGAFGLL